MKEERLNEQVKDMAPYKAAVEVPEGIPIVDMVKLMIQHAATQHLCVVDEEGRLQGLVSRRRIFQAVFSRYVPGSGRVSELYTLKTCESASDLLVRHVFTAFEDDPIEKIIRAMIEREICEVPVVGTNGKVLGLLTLDVFLKEMGKARARGDR